MFLYFLTAIYGPIASVESFVKNTLSTLTEKDQHILTLLAFLEEFGSSRNTPCRIPVYVEGTPPFKAAMKIKKKQAKQSQSQMALEQLLAFSSSAALPLLHITRATVRFLHIIIARWVLYCAGMPLSFIQQSRTDSLVFLCINRNPPPLYDVTGFLRVAKAVISRLAELGRTIFEEWAQTLLDPDDCKFLLRLNEGVSQPNQVRDVLLSFLMLSSQNTRSSQWR